MQFMNNGGNMQQPMHQQQQPMQQQQLMHQQQPMQQQPMREQQIVLTQEELYQLQLQRQRSQHQQLQRQRPQQQSVNRQQHPLQVQQVQQPQFDNTVPTQQLQSNGNFGTPIRNNQQPSVINTVDGGLGNRRRNRGNSMQPPQVYNEPPQTAAVPETDALIIKKVAGYATHELVTAVFTTEENQLDTIYPMGDSGYGGDETYANLRVVAEKTSSPVVHQVTVTNTVPVYDESLSAVVDSASKKNVTTLLHQLVSNNDAFGLNLDKKLTILLNSIVADTKISVDSYCGDLIDLCAAAGNEHTDIIIKQIDKGILSKIVVTNGNPEPIEGDDNEGKENTYSNLTVSVPETLVMLPAELEDCLHDGTHHSLWGILDEVCTTKTGLIYLVATNNKFMVTRGIDSTYKLTSLK